MTSKTRPPPQKLRRLHQRRSTDVTYEVNKCVTNKLFELGVSTKEVKPRDSE